MHLAAQHGHGQVLEVMRSYQSLRISSKKLGVTALHVAAYFGQAGAYIFNGKVDHLEHVLHLTLYGPCLVINLCNKNQQDALSF